MRYCNRSGFSKIAIIFVLCLPLVSAGLFLSCADLFTTSLGGWAARDNGDIVPDVTVTNVDDLVALAENDTGMSIALLEKIQDALDAGNHSSQNRAKLQSAALETAVNATGIVPALFGAAGNMNNINNNGSDILEKGLPKMKNLIEANTILDNILPLSENRAEWNAFIAEARPSDMAMAAVLIFTADYSGNPETMINDFTTNSSLARELAGAAYEQRNNLNETTINLLIGIKLIYRDESLG